MRRPEQFADSVGWRVQAPARGTGKEGRLKARNLGMAGRSREREAALTSGQAVKRRWFPDLATDQGLPKRDGRGA
jgi:hypothetical protein